MAIEEEKEEKVRFRNNGGPYLHIDGKIKAPGKVFKAYPSDISESLRIHIKPLDGIDEPSKKPLPTATIKGGYEIVNKSPGWYDVIQNDNGKIVNEKGLRKEAAEELINSLSK